MHRRLIVSMIKKFLTIFTAYVFTYIFTDILTHIVTKRQKSIKFYKYSVSRMNSVVSHFYKLNFI